MIPGRHHGRQRYRKGSDLRLADTLRGCAHRLPDRLKRDLFLLAQADQHQPLRRYRALRVIQQYFVGLAFEFLGLHQLAQRAPESSIKERRILLGQYLSFTMREYQHLFGCGLRSPNLTVTCMIFIHVSLFSSLSQKKHMRIANSVSK